MSLSKKKLLILGHSGFIGSHLEHSLSASGKWDVIGRSLPDIDLTEFSSASQLKTYFTPDTTVVLAAAIKRQFGDTLQAYRQNMAIVENLCQLLQHAPVRKIVFFSSAAVYGEETENTSITEQTLVQPTSYYGISKFSAECLLRKACNDNKVTSLVCLRPPLIYGSSDQGRSYGPSGFSTSVLEGSKICLWGDGEELREFIYIDDVCRIVEHFVEMEVDGEFNLVSGTSRTFLDVVSILRSHRPGLELEMRARSKKKVDNAFVASKIKSTLPPNFCFTSLEEGLAKILGATK
jgi:UDP-glucose 4-epimerase